MTPESTESFAIPVARVIELDVPRSWQEVVAVVMEAGEVARQGGSKLSAEGCLISTIGDLRLESVAGARLLGPEIAVPSMLADLLEGQTAPEALRTLVNSSQDSAQGIDALLAGLAYFERPQRRADIAALATRAVAAEADARANSELNRLRRTTPGRATTTEAAPASSARLQLGKRAIGTLVAAVAWFLVGVAVTGWLLSRPGQPESAPPESAAQDSTAQDSAAPNSAVQGSPPVDGSAAAEPPAPSGVGGILAAASDALNTAATAGLRAIGLAAPADDSAKPPGPPPSAAARPSSGRTKAGSASATTPAAVPAVPTIATPVPVAPTPVELVPVAAEPVGATLPPPPKPVFFSDVDGDVEPPVLVYPQLPEPPSSSVAPGQAYFEILVNEGGTVERVRLMAAQARFQDRMLVSAAKAWRFKPATKGGESVRYLLKVPTTQSSPESR
jgi:periplasmic protein TonB